MDDVLEASDVKSTWIPEKPSWFCKTVVVFYLKEAPKRKISLNQFNFGPRFVPIWLEFGFWGDRITKTRVYAHKVFKSLFSNWT